MNKNVEIENESVCLEEFAKMAGFPVDLIKKELFKNQEDQKDVSLEDLRSAMLSYLDSTMMSDSSSKLS